ncbi:MAG: hypothetical protein MI784_00745 [Cytophagales bacterium]|nr:hypothetical protein [Cytophagales bacterium]
MKKSFILLLLLTLTGFTDIRAQSTEGDFAFMNSYRKKQGSARIQAMGGAQTALGGDISSIAGNPAGLGFFRSSTFGLTLNLGFKDTKTDYLSNRTSNSSVPFSFDQLGVVIAEPASPEIADQRDWRAHNFGISFQRLNDFNQTVEFSGLNSSSDILDFYAANAGGGNLYGDLAFRSYLIDNYQVFQDNVYTGNTTMRILPTVVPSENTPTRQNGSIERSGSSIQFSFAYGTNYMDKLFFGANLGVVTSSYEMITSYHEFFPEGELVEHFLDERYQLRGMGVNLGLGAIYKPNERVNLGFNLLTPTIMGFEEEFEAEINSYFENFTYVNGEEFTNNDNPSEKIVRVVPDDEQAGESRNVESAGANSDVYINNWTLYTPMRLNFGAAYFFSKQGFLTADLEWVNYKGIKIVSRDFSGEKENKINNEIDGIYQSVLNFRAGGEYRLQNFRFRAGYAYSGNPVRSSVNHPANQRTHDYSLGLGYRRRDWSVDLTSVFFDTRKLEDVPYALDNPNLLTPVASSKVKQWQLTLSANYYF